MADRIRPDIEEYRTVSSVDKWKKVCAENPSLPIGMGIGTVALGYMIYGIRNSKNKLSVHLIHTRLAVQGSVVGCLTAVLGYQFFK